MLVTLLSIKEKEKEKKRMFYVGLSAFFMAILKIGPYAFKTARYKKRKSKFLIFILIF